MKNVDVPMWDKGDSTDDYAKGGGSHSSTMYNIPSNEDKEKELKEIFFLVLGREPSSRELSYYKYSIIKKGEIVKSLLSSDEHKETISRGIKYPELEKMNKLSENSILKLRTVLDDKSKELEEMQKLLNEKNNEIKKLREKQNVPYVTDKELLDKQNNTDKKYYSGYSKKSFNDYTLLERILNLFFGKNI